MADSPAFKVPWVELDEELVNVGPLLNVSVELLASVKVSEIVTEVNVTDPVFSTKIE